jgi:hypothetical protein
MAHLSMYLEYIYTPNPLGVLYLRSRLAPRLAKEKWELKYRMCFLKYRASQSVWLDLIRNIQHMQLRFSLCAAKGRTLQREPFSIAITTGFHFAQYKMLLWQIVVNHVVRINFISFPLLNPIRFVYYICEKIKWWAPIIYYYVIVIIISMGILFITSTTI